MARTIPQRVTCRKELIIACPKTYGKLRGRVAGAGREEPAQSPDSTIKRRQNLCDILYDLRRQACVLSLAVDNLKTKPHHRMSNIL